MAFHLKKTALLIFALIFCYASGYGQQQPQAVFDNANEMLEAGEYRQALSLYKNIESQNTVSGALYLNLGIAYQRVDSLGKAKYYFMKASNFEETSDEAEKALEFVESQFSRQSAVLPKLPWDVATDWLKDNIGAENLLIAGILLLNIGVLLFVGHWFLNWFPRYMRLSGLIVVGLSVLIIGTSFYTHYVSERYSQAVMVTQKMPVLESPQEQASLISQAYEGYTFTVDHYKSDTKPGWSYVRMSNGQYGWIPNSEILIL